MRRAAIVVLVVCVAAAILLVMRRNDVESDRSDARDVQSAVAVGTIAPQAPRTRRPAKDADAAPTPVARRIDGVVIDYQSDEPIAGAEILAARRRTPEPREGFLDTELPGATEFRAMTSTDGKFLVDVPTDGPWFVTARAAEHVDAARLARAGDELKIKLFADAEETLTVVRAGDETPIPGADVWVLADKFKPPARLHLVADEHGVARIRVSPDEKLVVSAPERATCFTDAEEGERTIALARGYRIAGIVRDHAGRGVAGATLKDLGHDVGAWITDADGRFSMDGLAAGDECQQSVEIRAEGFVNTWEVLHCGATDEVVELRKWIRVEGMVFMPDGSPAVDAKVAEAVTDAQGAFVAEIEPNVPEAYATWARPGGSKDAELEGSAKLDAEDGATVSGVVVRLGRAKPPRRSYVVLRVVDSDGHPVTDISTGREDEVRGDVVVLHYFESAGTKRTLRVRDSQTRHRWAEIQLEAVTQPSPDAPPIDVRIPAPREFTVQVRAPDGGALPESVTPKMQVGEGWSWFEVARVREDRTSVTWMLGAGERYVLEVGAEGFAPLKHVLVEEEIASGRLVVRLEQGVTVRGRIVSTDPRAMRSSTVDLWGGAGRAAGQSENDGTFCFVHVAAGAWQFGVRWPRCVVVDREVRVAGDADVDLGDIEVPPSRVVRGVVQTSDGKPCAGGVVDAFLAGEESSDQAVPTREDGSFEITTSSLRGGALLVSHDGLGAAVVRLDETDPGKPLVVRLASDGKIDVRIRLPHPSPDAWSWQFQTPDGAVRWQPRDDVRMRDKLGFDERYVVSGLGPGAVVVEISSTQWTFSSTVSVVAGATTPVVVGPDN